MRDLEKLLLDPEDQHLLQNKIYFPLGYPSIYVPSLKRVEAIHRIIMGSRNGFEIDHINRNKLDNRRINLRFITHQENLRNRNGWGKLPKGVYFDKTNKRKKPYKAMLRINGKSVNFGYFATVEEAVTEIKRHS